MACPVYKYKIKLNGKEKQELRQAKKKGRKNARLVIRILIILLADAGKTMVQTAEILGCCEQTVLNQRQRFVTRRAEGAVTALLDLPRTGRPVTKERAQVVAIVCETLEARQLPLSRFSINSFVAASSAESSFGSTLLSFLIMGNGMKPPNLSAVSFTTAAGDDFAGVDGIIFDESIEIKRGTV